MENFEQFILLLVSGQGLVVSLALLSGVFKNKYANFFFGLLTAVITIEILNIWGMRVSYHNVDNAFPFWVFGSYLMVPPALWLFVRTNMHPTFQPKAKNLLFFIPALLEIVVELFSYYSNRSLGTGYHLMENYFWYVFTEIVPVVTMILVLVLFAKELKKARVRFKKMLGTKKGLPQLSKLYVLFMVFSFLTLFWLLLAVFDVQVFIVIEVILLIFLFSLGYLGHFQPAFFDIPQILKTELMNDRFPQFNDEKELEKLRVLFEEKKLFTKQKLSLKEVAGHLALPERYVSVLINGYHNNSFSAYVNSFRVKDALQRIADPTEQHKTLLGIALESGFNSKSSFNSVFKAVTGKNPSEFLKESTGP